MTTIWSGAIGQVQQLYSFKNSSESKLWPWFERMSNKVH